MHDLVVTDNFDPRVEDEQFVLADALAHGISGHSDIVRRYELALAKDFGMEHAVSASSGFGALVVALSALGLEPGDKVLLTPTCPLCTVYALTFLRLVPVFCDTRRDDFGADINHAQVRFDDGVAAMIEIPMWGYPVDARAARSFCDARRIPLVLDIALAHKARLDGQLLGAYGEVATFSTHWSKNFVTGEGGCVLTDDPQIAAKARAFSYPDDTSAARPSLNFAMAGLQAALGLARLSRLDDDVDRRRETMALILRELDNPYLEPLPVVPGGETGGTKLLLRETSGCNLALLAHMDRHHVPSDIQRYGCRALYEYPVLRAFRTPCPNAEALLASITTVPLHPDLSQRQVEHIVRSLNSYRPPKTGKRSRT
jgi:perosamine synthetase